MDFVRSRENVCDDCAFRIREIWIFLAVMSRSVERRGVVNHLQIGQVAAAAGMFRILRVQKVFGMGLLLLAR